MLDQAETTGLVCGYKVDGTGGMEELSWADMDAALDVEDNVVWLHFNHADPRARDWIQSTTHLPPAGKALLLGADTHMRIEVCGNGLAGVVGDLHHEFAEKSDQLDVLRLYLDNRCLISARCEPLHAIDKLRRAIGDGLKVERPIAIIAQFLHHVTDTLGDLLLELTGNVDDLEDQLLAGNISDRVPELARIRRIAVRLHRHMVPQQHALVSLLSRMPTWIDEAGATALRNAIERLAALGHDLDLVQDRARLLGDQLSGRLMEATNRNLYILSIVTTIFLPMTLVTGIFGMNLGGLPGQSHPLGFWYGMAIMVVLGLVTLILLRRRRML
jgi:zinc transporter